MCYEIAVMGLVVALGEMWLSTLAWLAGLATGFAVLTRLFPCNPGMYWWKDRRAVVTDIAYWFLTPLIVLVGRVAMLAGALWVVFGGDSPPITFVTAWPLWLQVIAVVVLQDVMLYWLHRAFHTSVGWSFHAVHHSPQVLDWFSLARFHPVNQLLQFALADVVVVLMGFPLSVLIALAPFNLVYSAMTHANLNWTFGPFKYVLASPVFHRWHHTSEAEGLNKNFAPTLPVLDLIFGTFHMPAGRVPQHFGTGDTAVPTEFLEQLVYPFRAMGRRSIACFALGLLMVVSVVGWAFVAQRQPNEAMANRYSPARVPPPAAPPAPLPPARMITAEAKSADGQVVVEADAEGNVIVRFANQQEQTYTVGGVVTGVAVSAKGEWLAASFRQSVMIWDSRTRQGKTLDGHTALVSCVAMTPDGARVAAGAFDGRVVIWNATTGETILTRSSGSAAITAVELNAGRVIVRAANSAPQEWIVP